MQSVFRNLAVLLLSAVGIAYQVALMRIFSIGQWHHFAYMVISIAMLGFGASGSGLAMARRIMQGWEAFCMRIAALASTASLVLCHAAAQSIPFETFELVSQPTQFWWLAVLYLILAAPFFFLASAITLAFFLESHAVGRLYAFNMTGSGLGAVAVALLLYHVPPVAMPSVLTGASAIATLLLFMPGWRDLVKGCVFLLLIGGTLAAVGPVSIRVSQYKGLSYTLQYPDATIVARTRSPLSEITAVSSQMIRETPGQISNYPMSEKGALPAQIGLFFDAGAVSPVHRFDGHLEPFAFLDYVTGALPYRLTEHPDVLVLGAGGGTDVLSALAHGASHVTAVEVDPGVRGMLLNELTEFSGHLYERPDVTLIVAEGRGFLEARQARYDLVVLPLFGSFGASAAGVHALNESYLYTVEAIRIYLERLNPDGLLAMTCWLKTPPRDAIKLFATAVEACERLGLSEPARHLAFIRSWNNATIIVSRSPMSDGQIDAIRRFSGERFFDMAHCPGIMAEEANQYVILDKPIYYEAAQDILSPRRETFYRNYLFHIRPATDDRPHFYHFMKWGSLPELWRNMGSEWIPFVEWGYIVLLATILQGALAGTILILLPLMALARSRTSREARTWTLACFACLGLAYMFLEIAFVQIFMRFLAYPVYAVSVVLAAFLIFSGLGSFFADRVSPNRKSVATAWAVSGIAMVSLVYMVVLPSFFHAAASWSDPAKATASIFLLAPLAFCMGVPFPSGLQIIARRPDALMPWAFGINGCASVLGASLAALAAVHLGFRVVTFMAIVLYLVAAASVRKLARAC